MPHGAYLVRRLRSLAALSLYELTSAEPERQEETARAQVDGRRELAPGALALPQLATRAKIERIAPLPGSARASYGFAYAPLRGLHMRAAA